MSKSKADMLKTGLSASLADFQNAAPREYPASVEVAQTDMPTPTESTRLNANPTTIGDRTRRGRPPSQAGRMIPFASRVKETHKQTLADLAYQTSKTETALLEEALNLLFKRYSK